MTRDKKPEYFDRYPLTTVFVSNAVSLLLYIAGGYILFRLHFVVTVLYIILILWLELKLYRGSCKDCWYYGKVCAFGKGKIACIFIKKGNPADFAQRDVSWKAVLPDILVSVIPVIAGIILMIIDFSWLLLAAVIIILLLMSLGNGYVRGKRACLYCKQRELGCPADKLFTNGSSKTPV